MLVNLSSFHNFILKLKNHLFLFQLSFKSPYLPFPFAIFTNTPSISAHTNFNDNEVVLKVEIHEDKIKQKAMKAVSGISGVESVSVDMKDKKLTLTGDIDPVQVVAKLRKFCRTDIVSVGPVKEEKKEQPKKDDKKKDDKKDSKDNVTDPLKFNQTYAYYYPMKPQYYPCYSAIRVEEDPNSCKVVLKVELQDDKIKKKAMKVVSNISGVESVSVDMKDQKLTLIGDMDAVIVVDKLRKVCYTEILSVGPAKEEKKGTDKDKEKKVEKNNNDQNTLNVYEAYHIQMRQPHYYYTSIEENPNACVIC
ncbi:Heavy metal-associated isoprenylated plant protein 39, partial [Mucuna pruriens]